MAGAGSYPNRFRLMACSRTTDTTTGDRPKAYTEAGYLWGSLDVQSATEETDRGAVRHLTYGVVRLRQYPTVSALDRLYLPDTGTTYEIEGVRYGDNETILDVRSVEAT